MFSTIAMSALGVSAAAPHRASVATEKITKTVLAVVVPSIWSGTNAVAITVAIHCR